MRILSSAILITGLALAAMPVFAQSKPNQDPFAAQPSAVASVLPLSQQATKEQVEKLFEVMRLHKQMEAMMNMMPGMIQQQYHEQLKNIFSKLPPGKQLMPQDEAALEKVMNKYMQEAINGYPIDQMLADAIPVYQHHVSRADADAVIAFYSSQPGQRLLDEQPAILQEYMPIVIAHMQDFTKRLTDEMTAEMQGVIKSELLSSGASTPKSN